MPTELKDDRVERFKRFTESKLKGVSCPDHRRPPRILFYGTRLGEMTISLSGCCPKLMRLANEAVARPATR